MRVALAFPDLSRDRPEDFMQRAARLGQKPDLLVLPENAYTTTGNSLQEFQHLSSHLQRFATNTGIGVIAGIGIGATAGTRLTWLQTDNWALMARPGESMPMAYHKHTSSLRTGFDGAGWNSHEALPLFEHKGEKAGLTICHDLFVSPLQRQQAEQGASLLINISYANVRAYQWRTLLQAQAITNRVPMLYTLHRNPDTALPQQAIYGFGPRGEFNLVSDAGNLRDIDPDERTGRLYIVDTKQAQMASPLPMQPSRRDWNGSGRVHKNGAVTGKLRSYEMIDLGLQDFIHRPEVMWRHCLNMNPAQTPVFRVNTTSSEYLRHRAQVHTIAPARMIEFGSVAVMQAEKPMAVCYRSSNYKDTFFSEATSGRVLAVDERYLFGPGKTLDLLNGTDAGDDSQSRQNFGQLVRAISGAPAPVL